MTVLERAGALREVGAGIQLSPNAFRVLEALGIGGAIMDVSAPSRGVELRAGRTGAFVARIDYARHRPGAPFRVIHRARLVETLERAARAHGVTIRLGHEVADLPHTPLLIGADGLRSRVRAALNGAETPFFTGQVAWRAVIPLEAGAAPVAQLFMGEGRHLVSYPLAGGLRNIVAVEERAGWTAEDWATTDDPMNLRAAFAGFGGPVAGWLDQVRQCGLWGLFRHEVAPRWHNHTSAILGDAAHPTLPFLAQGAALAIEDAWTLAACLDSDADQHAALSLYQSLRQPRATRVVAASNANARNYHLGGAARIAAHAALRAGSVFAPALLFRRVAWVFDHDPTALQG